MHYAIIQTCIFNCFYFALVYNFNSFWAQIIPIEETAIIILTVTVKRIYM